MRVLVVEDDVPARAHAVALLNSESDVLVVGECGDGNIAVQQIALLRPDLVLMDVLMPGLDGFGVVASVGVASMPQVIFVSAYSDFAVRAFEAYALDYVLKPYQPERLRDAIGRARQLIAVRRQLPTAESAESRLHALLAAVSRGTAVRYPESLAVKLGDQYHVLRVADIEWIEADGNHARVHLQGRSRIIAKSLALLERQVLDPARFIRVHRSAIVNVDRIVAVEPVLHGDVELVLQHGARVDCSRRYRSRLEERLFFTT